MKLELRGVDIAVGDGDARRWLVRGLTTAIEPGLCVVVGPNGAGKTTLLRTLAGLATPTAGHLTLDGRRLEDHGRIERARRLAYLPQDTTLTHDLRVRELVMLGRLPYLSRLGGPGPPDVEMVTRALADVELEGFADRRVSTLSGGERQRAMLARMLAGAADVLVLDEPTTALDVRHGLDVLALCHALGADGRTVIVALHDLPLARRHADRALCLTGDPAGTVHVGPAATILHPDILSEVFGVRMALRGDDLLVAPGPRRCPPRRRRPVGRHRSFRGPRSPP
jgi:iron complex transport system ATP-binding protein